MTATDDLIRKIEKYVIKSFNGIDASLSTAHDFKHVDRVRNWALIIAQGEGAAEIDLVEITALLHDIGLAFVNDGEVKNGYIKLPPHGPLGADVTTKYLKDNSNLSMEMIQQIADAIRHHSDPPLIAEEHLLELGGKRKLLEIIRDSDTMDALGAIGIMRALTSKSFLPEYNPETIKGDAWNLSTTEFISKFGFDSKSGLPPVNTIVDQINQQIRYKENLHTETAKKYALPLVEYMKQFITKIDNEITHSVD